MTKKFIESYLDSNKKRPRKKEFVIPDILNFTNNFIGIETKKEYSHGMICYTGLDLDTRIVTDRLLENQIITTTTSDLIKIIDLYLADIIDWKISNILTVRFENDRFELILSDLKINMKKSRIR